MTRIHQDPYPIFGKDWIHLWQETLQCSTRFPNDDPGTQDYLMFESQASYFWTLQSFLWNQKIKEVASKSIDFIIIKHSISKNSRHNLNWKYLTLTTSSLADGISQNSLSRCDTSFQELFTSASISYNDITVLEYIATQPSDTFYYGDLKISLLFLRKIITLGSCVPIGLSNQVFCLFINSIDVS